MSDPDSGQGPDNRALSARLIRGGAQRSDLRITHRDLPPLRPVVGAARSKPACMGASIVLGLAAIRNRDIARHRAWMTRAYALGLGAGSQTLTVGFGQVLFGSGVVRTDLMMGARWVINLAVAELFIRRASGPRARPLTHAVLAGSP